MVVSEVSYVLVPFIFGLHIDWLIGSTVRSVVLVLEEQEMGGVARSAVAQGVATCTTGTSTRQNALR